MPSKWDLSRLARWSRAVIRWNNHTCDRCGRHKFLEAHHVKPKSLFPRLAYRLFNGKVLCKYCHRLLDDSLHKTVDLKDCNIKTYRKWLKATKYKYRYHVVSSSTVVSFLIVAAVLYYTINSVSYTHLTLPTKA